jgi:hypothetical protein
MWTSRSFARSSGPVCLVSGSCPSARALLHASFGPRLAASPLRFANPSPPSGWAKDFHLLVAEHAPHTKKKGLNLIAVQALWNLSRRRPTFPHSCPCSIIGPARLNFRVRDGNGCDPRGMTTGKTMKLYELRSPDISAQISGKKLGDASKAFQLKFARRNQAPRTTVLAGNYKFDPQSNKL